MTRLGTVFWLVLVLVAGFTTFKVKYAIQDTEDELNRVRRQMTAEQQEIRVLTAEWTYLNQPERLSELNRRFLGLASVTTKQLQRTIEEIPLRAPRTPIAAPPDAVVEARSAPAAPSAAPTPPAVTPAALTPAPAVSGPLPAASRAVAQDDAPGADRPHPPIDPAPTRPAKAAPVQLATAGPGETAKSLDALIAQIVETR
ncbi:MAG TPA: hypothetical protein VGS13_00435 [Stellaceae bacterium]|nr:hypothetical protein [Stellaceae bacterium]